MSVESIKDYFTQYKKDMGALKQELPEMTTGFRQFYRSVMKDGALDLKSKELIALAIGVATGCDSCIYAHVAACLHAGASKDEIMEAATVAVVMNGGPAYTHMPQVRDAIEALKGG